MKSLALIPLLVVGLPALAWEAKPLSEIAVYPERAAPAVVMPLAEAKAAAELTARVEQLSAEPGQVVAKGSPLLKLDCRDQDLAVERAKAALALAEAQSRLAAATLSRATKAAQEKGAAREPQDIPMAEVEVAKANVALQASALKTAQHLQTKCVVIAPFNALITARLVQTGEVAVPGMPLMALLDSARMEVKAEVREQDMASLKVARSVRLAGPEVDHPLRLARISLADKTTHLAEARLRFNAKPALPGVAGKIEWNTNEAHVPAEAVVKRNGRLGVLLAEGKTTRFHALPSAEEGRPAPATGLKPEHLIVVSGAAELH